MVTHCPHHPDGLYYRADMPYPESRLHFREILGRLSATALLALTLQLARDTHAQEPPKDDNPHPITAFLPPEDQVSLAAETTTYGEAIALTPSRLRAAPHTSSSLVGRLAVGERVPIVDRVEDGQYLDLRGVQSSVWYEIEINEETTAFVWSGLVDVEGNDPLISQVDEQLHTGIDILTLQAIREFEPTQPDTITTFEDTLMLTHTQIPHPDVDNASEVAPLNLSAQVGEYDSQGNFLGMVDTELTINPADRLYAMNPATDEREVVPLGQLTDWMQDMIYVSPNLRRMVDDFRVNGQEIEFVAYSGIVERGRSGDVNNPFITVITLNSQGEVVPVKVRPVTGFSGGDNFIAGEIGENMLVQDNFGANRFDVSTRLTRDGLQVDRDIQIGEQIIILVVVNIDSYNQRSRIASGDRLPLEAIEEGDLPNPDSVSGVTRAIVYSFGFLYQGDE